MTQTYMTQTPAIPLTLTDVEVLKTQLTQLHFSKTAKSQFKNEVPKLKT
jgi:hypothetical protein